MPRANRYFLPGYIWHVTHRCHKKEFLLKFARDRRRFLQWLFEAKKRFGISVLNYSVTSNHIHLILSDPKGRDAIPQTMQLVAGRTGQEYNQRKNRKGAFWEDRYHATAIEGETHLKQCMVYVDLNMVRAGNVTDPSEWPFCGYNEIQNPRRRYALIDHESLTNLFGQGADEFKESYRSWIEEALDKNACQKREPRWTESIAVGTEGFVKDVQQKLGPKAMWREVAGGNGPYELSESPAPYNGLFDGKNAGLSEENSLFWDLNR